MSLDVYLFCGTCGSSLIDFNVTHNLRRMASEAGCYEPLWRAPESGITTAGQLIAPLRAALFAMKSDPDRFLPLNPPNGWGTYDGFVDALGRLLAECERSPEASVETSR